MLHNVALASRRTSCAAVALKGQLKLFAVPAHPAYLARGHARNHRMVVHVPGNDGARTDERIATDRHTAHDRTIGAKCRSGSNTGLAVFGLPAHPRTGIKDVGEYRTRTTEDAVLQDDAVIERHIVLDLAVISNYRACSDKHILTKHYVPPNFGAGAHMDEMPDTGSVADPRVIINDRTVVPEEAHHAALEVASG